MRLGRYKFDRLEFSGSLGDLGTLIPLSVALIVINGLGPTPVLMMVGIYYIIAGVYFNLPIPVQPLKVVSAIAIAYPEQIQVPVIGAAGIIFGIILLILSVSGVIDRLGKLFTKPIVRGIQFGLGFILMHKGLLFMMRPELFVQRSGFDISVFGIHLNLLIGIFGFVLALWLLSSQRFPAALVLVSVGLIVGGVFGGVQSMGLVLGPTPVRFIFPSTQDVINATLLLVLPQLPLTIGNAVMGTADTCISLFGSGGATKRATYRAFATSMGLMNMVVGAVGAMPMCHGSGGLAAHYRFGARTGGSNMMIGCVFLILALIFGKAAVAWLTSIPNGVLGVLLLFAGLELALLIRDIESKKDLFIALLIAGIGFSTTNMGIAFTVGIVVNCIIRWKRIDI